MSQARGKTLHREFPRWLAANGWPGAEACPGGRQGRDVDGIPGIAWEIKTAGAPKYDPGAWVRQAVRNAGPDLPVVTWFPPGVGIGSVDLTVSILPTMELLRLLKEAGYMS